MNNANNNHPIDEIEKGKILKDIAEIDQILALYNQAGYLDQDHRNRAIQKIMDARREEAAIQIVLMPKSPMTAIPYPQASTPQLCKELHFIKNYLAGKLTGKVVKSRTEWNV